MRGSDSECESLDSGLETGGNSNLGLETSEAGFVEVGTVSEDSEAEEKRPDSGASEESHLSDFSEGIYENAAVLKSSNMSSPVTTALEKYEFGQHEPLSEDTGQFPVEKRTQSGDTEDGSSDNEADLENFESSSAVVSSVKKSWGVRREMGMALDRVERSANPIEEIIAKDIRELKEREEELIRLREQGNTDEEEEVKEEAVIEPEEPILELEPPAKFITTSNLRLNETKPINNDSKFNPSLYGPSILSPRGKPGIMQNFINNKGKVNAFKLPDRDTVVTLRKPQVYKSVPKVSPPVSSSGLRQTGNVLDKIQAELAETKRREDELRRQRRGVTRSQPDLSNLGTRESEAETGDTEGAESGEEEEETPSLVCTRGKSALISVWENRIQCEKAA